MARSETTPVTKPVATFAVGDYVLYRDPELYWAGKPGHTLVARVEGFYHNDWNGQLFYRLCAVVSGLPIREARADYMRLLPPEDAMRDIDTAPLNAPLGEAAADGLSAGAVAWLTQQPSTANRRPQLPPARD
ncbi:hypothetical protein [Streptomyces sp. NRRL F-5630]|uniref:hypothetical protein n=1 Tax=Streptomyces sp. NRRL F-5630 TaxID=1463864 RepID=UPI003D73882A